MKSLQMPSYVNLFGMLIGILTFLPQLIITSKLFLALLYLLILLVSLNKAVSSKINLNVTLILILTLLLSVGLINSLIIQEHGVILPLCLLAVNFYLFSYLIDDEVRKSFFMACSAVMSIAIILGFLQFGGLIDFGTRVFDYSHLLGSSSSISAKRVTSFFFEPAAYGFFLAVFAAYNLIKGRHLLLFASIISLMLTRSGTGFITFFLLLLFIYIPQIVKRLLLLRRNQASIDKSLLMWISFIFVLSISLFSIASDLFLGYFVRFSSLENIYITTPYRTGAPLCILNSWFEVIPSLASFFGNGIGSITHELIKCGLGYESYSSTTHLSFTDILYELGLLGVFAIPWAFYTLLRMKLPLRSSNLSSYLFSFIGIFLIIPYRSPQMLIMMSLLFEIIRFHSSPVIKGSN